MSQALSIAHQLQRLMEGLSRLEGHSKTQHARIHALLEELNRCLAQDDSLLEELLHLTIMPKVNHLLLDLRHEHKLQNHTKTILKRINRGEKPREALPPPQPGPYKPIPMPFRDDERKSLIEDTLNKLKMLLSDHENIP